MTHRLARLFPAAAALALAAVFTLLAAVGPAAAEPPPRSGLASSSGSARHEEELRFDSEVVTGSVDRPKLQSIEVFDGRHSKLLFSPRKDFSDRIVESADEM